MRDEKRRIFFPTLPTILLTIYILFYLHISPYLPICLILLNQYLVIRSFLSLEVDPNHYRLLEVKEISNEATKDVLFEQAESNKRSNSNKSDQPKKKHKNQVKQI